MKFKKGSLKILILLLIIFLVTISSYILILRNRDNDSNKFIHLSIDDTISLFEDITYNENSYESIFENETLKYLKKMNRKYGAVFSFYCFYKNDNFDLSQCTSKFADEFTENASWLKFGFHNINNEGNLSNADGKQADSDYQLVIKELVRITGDENCLDTVIRLQNFAGNLEVIKSIKNTSNGVIGLFTADDDRASYYLDIEDNKYIDENDYFYDDENDLFFISTDLRLEKTISPYYKLMNISKDNKQNNIIEVFTHEWNMNMLTKLKINETCFFASKNGYSWDFPMNR